VQRIVVLVESVSLKSFQIEPRAKIQKKIATKIWLVAQFELQRIQRDNRPQFCINAAVIFVLFGFSTLERKWYFVHYFVTPRSRIGF
jgi:hypothetical protein